MKMFEGSKYPYTWKKLCFGLCFFHALIQERRTFGPLGWNIPYEFNETDLRISVQQVHMFIDQYPDVPYDALTYLVGQCNYGGRVTDDHDRRLLLALLADYFSPQIMHSTYFFDLSQDYYAPDEGDHGSYVKYIKELPDVTPPGIYGLHANADITKDEREMTLFLGTVLITQPKNASAEDNAATAATPKQVALEMAQDMLKQMRVPFDVEDVQKKRPIMYLDSMNTVLLQELHRFNKLISTIRSTLQNLIKALNGEIVLTSQLEQMMQEMYDQKLPELWKKSSYPSLKPIGAYYSDLRMRIDFFEKWIEEGPPPVFWLSGFYFTQSFLTGVLQNYARNKKLPIDTLSWNLTVMKEPKESFTTPPATGCYIRGLYLEGAGWDVAKGIVAESTPKILYIEFPVMWLQPMVTKDLPEVHAFDCPLYRTADRRGVLMTTGHSTNFVMKMKLPIAKTVEPAHWVKRGVALLCALNY